MVIHINPNLQSCLVLEKKMIYFLEHAGVRGWFCYVTWLHRTVFAATRLTSTVTLIRKLPPLLYLLNTEVDCQNKNTIDISIKSIVKTTSCSN